ncbi:glycosyltransferase [Adhaeribacter terreus]|uniref:Glycosyltransferase n=1 Tax=Adhaeribacter terreus TaxID=529703 RepID=A0ABW0EF18_9BACT
MIFVTIGTQAPFDRLIKTLDEIAPQLEMSIVAQVFETRYKAKNIETFDFLNPTDFQKYFYKSDLIISHAGMGTIISALQSEKPILILPRLASLNEHRNDHQLATAKMFDKLNFINVSYNESELIFKLRDMLNGELKPLHKIGPQASTTLIKSIENFINS